MFFCCCGTPTCTLGVTVRGCVGGTASQFVAGASVVVSQGGTTIASGTTGSLGDFTATVPASGTYSVQVSKTGYCTQTATKVVTCPGSNALTVTLAPASLPVTVTGCVPNVPIAGIVVTVVVSQGGTTIDTQTTSTGTVTVAMPCTGTFTVTASAASRFASNTATVTQTAAQANCKVTIQLPAATGYHCWACCNLPIPDTLHATDSVFGAVTLTYAGTQSFTCHGFTAPVNTWSGSITVNFPGRTCGGVTCAAAAGVVVTYTLYQPINVCADCVNTFGYLGISYPSTFNPVTGASCPGGAGGTASVLSQAAVQSCPPGFSTSFDLPACNSSQMLFPGGTVTVTE